MSTTFDVSSMTKLDGPGNLKAIANVVINGEIAVNGIKLVESEKGLFPSMPTKSINGEYVEMVHPITSEASQKLKEAGEAQVPVQVHVLAAQQQLFAKDAHALGSRFITASATSPRVESLAH